MTGERSTADEDTLSALAERRGLETDVYEPAEDSHLLAIAAANRIDGDDLVLDLGTGTGYVASLIGERTGARVVGADLNPHACRRAAANGIEAVRSDLVSPFRGGRFDAVVFNPPYLPTAPDAEWDDWMERALSGGRTGREVIEPFLDAASRVLAPDGVIYLLVSSFTGVDAVREYAADRGFDSVPIVEESYPLEKLVVLELRR